MKLQMCWVVSSALLGMLDGCQADSGLWIRTSYTPPAPAVTAHVAAAPVADGSEDMPIPADRDMPTTSYSSHVSATLGAPVWAMVDARSDIYSSSRTQPEGSRGGVLPASVRLPAGAAVITFAHVAGRVGCGTGDPMSGPDGGHCAGGDTHINRASGLSGIVDHRSTQFLVGVFLAGRPPRTPPEALDFGPDGLGHDFASLTPEVGQVFFIGDGLANGREQTFVVPPHATTLYLGIADAYAFQGDPGFYSDNKGGFKLSLTVADR